VTRLFARISLQFISECNNKRIINICQHLPPKIARYNTTLSQSNSVV